MYEHIGGRSIPVERAAKQFGVVVKIEFAERPAVEGFMEIVRMELSVYGFPE
jgi:hypothetical protein